MLSRERHHLPFVQPRDIAVEQDNPSLAIVGCSLGEPLRLRQPRGLPVTDIVVTSSRSTNSFRHSSPLHPRRAAISAPSRGILHHGRLGGFREAGMRLRVLARGQHNSTA